MPLNLSSIRSSVEHSVFAPHEGIGGRSKTSPAPAHGGLSQTQNCSNPMTVQSSTTVTDFKVRLFSSRKFGMRVAFCSCEPSYTNDEKQPCLPSVSSVRRRRRRADAHCRQFLPLPLYILRPRVDGTIFAAQKRSASSVARVVKRCAVFAAARRMCCRRLVDGMTCSGLSSLERVRIGAASVVSGSGELSDDGRRRQEGGADGR